MKKRLFFDYSLSLLICFTFVLGFIFNENSGGGRIDEVHILNNFNLIYKKNFFDINWANFESSSLPLYYFTFSLLLDEITLESIRLLNFLLSILTFFLFYLAIKKKYYYIDNGKLSLISSLILLSPYFRTSAYNALEENFAIFFIVLTFFLLIFFKKNFLSIFLILMSSFLAFYSRSNYVIFLIIIFITLFNFKKIISLNNIFISLISLILVLPFLYFLYIWGGIMSPNGGQARLVSTNFTNIVLVFNILLIYLIPFILFKINFKEIKFNNRIIFFILSVLLFSFFFYSQLELYQFAGGALNKLLHIFIQKKFIGFFSISIFIISFCSFFLLFKDNWKIILFVLFSSLLYLKINFIFQEYLDPIFLILVIIFSNKNFFQFKNFSSFIYFTVTYFSFFLLVGIYYQYNIV